MGLIDRHRPDLNVLAGTVSENEQTLAFARLQNIRPLIETFPLDQAQAAYGRMMRADVSFRAVLVMNFDKTGVDV